MNIKPGDWVLDPFMGSGTTALVCQMRNINSIGYDVMPISEICLKAKKDVFFYDLEEIRTLVKDIEDLKIPDGYNKRIPHIMITHDAYPEENEIFLQYIAEWRDVSGYSENLKKPGIFLHFAL